MRFSVDAYHKLAEFGILSDDDRVELLDGVISPKMIHSPIHDAVVSVVEQTLRPALAVDWMLRVQSSVTLARSEPEPDLAVVRAPALRYVEQHPGGQDIALVVEVAEPSLQRDRVKTASYAQAGIPVYWIVNLKERRLEVHQLPRAEAYTELTLLGADQLVEVTLGFRAVTSLRVSQLLP